MPFERVYNIILEIDFAFDKWIIKLLELYIICRKNLWVELVKYLEIKTILQDNRKLGSYFLYWGINLVLFYASIVQRVIVALCVEGGILLWWKKSVII